MVAFPLPARAIEAGYRVIGHDSVGSTNTEALAAANAGDPGGLWIAALCQTQGRGRRGRPWQSPYGNLAASLLVRPHASPDHLAGLGFVAGIALHAALVRLMPGAAEKIALKWPNDLLAGGAKLAGIGLEAVRTPPNGRTAAIVGIGVNVLAAPRDLPYPAAALRALGFQGDAPAVFEALAESWVECYEEWNHGEGTASIIARWRARAAGLGSEIAVRSGKGVLTGVFEDIDDAGRLIVRDDEGHRTAITAGDVHFGTTATLR